MNANWRNIFIRVDSRDSRAASFEEFFQGGALGGRETLDPDGFAALRGSGDGAGGRRPRGLVGIDVVRAHRGAEFVAQGKMFERAELEPLGVPVAGVAGVLRKHQRRGIASAPRTARTRAIPLPFGD